MNVRKMAQCALFAALLCLCAWLAVPMGTTVVTLQTFGIFLCLGLLGGKWGTLTIGVYLLLGAVGLPVFSGFRGGIGALLDATGGYLLGFLGAGILFWVLEARFGGKPVIRLTGWILGLLLCYGIGTLWFSRVYLGGGQTLGAALAVCVLPYLLPDALKLALAWLLTEKLKRFV